jgi:Tol biopolymer transport system component
MNSLKLLRQNAAALAMAALAACGEVSRFPVDPNDPMDPIVPVAAVSVSPAPISILEGRTSTLSAYPVGANGEVLSGRQVSWSSSETSVATVSQQGVVSAVAAGSTVIRATSDGKTGSAVVTVLAITPPPAEVASVSLDATALSLDEGQRAQLTATPRDVDGAPITGLGMIWTSSDVMIATVDALGKVTGVRPGSATIAVRVHGKTAEAVVTVSAHYAYDLMFSAYDGNALELFSLDFTIPDAQPVRVLGAGIQAGEARLSPDGTRIAFSGVNHGVVGIYVVNRDGTELRRVAAPLDGPVFQPTWSPDGTKLAYARAHQETGYDILVVNADGTHTLNLTASLGASAEWMPAWSPDLGAGASRIAFVRRVDGNENVWTMRADGTDLRQITTGVLDLEPAWSPDGRTIVFQRSNAVINADLQLVAAVGGVVRPVMSFMSLAGPQTHPRFSPDGRMIAFTSQHETWGQGGTPQIFTIWADGTNMARRTTAGGYWAEFVGR